MDRWEGKKGGGIWLHGHSPAKNIGFDVVDTKGCIVVSNDALREMNTFLNPRGTPIVIVNKLQFAKQEDQSEVSKELRAFLNSWKHSWESINTKKYLSYYSANFVNNEGMSFPDFKKHKERTNRTKKFIHVKIDNLAILIPPEHGGKIAIARFLQRYNSNNFKTDTRKIFYLRKGQTEWQIIGESSY
jgi:murein L,D-transpeptidase YafK